MPMWEGESTDPNKRGKYATPKQKLLDWINSRMPPDLPISNFTTDWNDGRAIGALVDSCAPGLKKNIYILRFKALKHYRTFLKVFILIGKTMIQTIS